MEQEKRYIEEDEITLKELILKVQEYFWEVVRNWKWVVGITIPFVVFFVYKAVTTPVTYQAELTFMVNEDDGGGLGGMSAILGQIGLGGGGRGKNNLDKILELAKSRTIVQQVIFDSVVVSGKTNSIGNHIIHIYNYHDEWNKKKSDLIDFLFRNEKPFIKIEKKALKTIYSKIVGNQDIPGMLSVGYNDNTGIMRFKVNTIEEELSISLCKILYQHLSNFYVTRTVEKQQQTFDVMLQKVDSVKDAMTAKEYQLAKFMDENRGLYTARAKRREFELQRDVKILNEMYSVTLKNFEIADFSLKNKTPFIQLIDDPISPLQPKEESLFKNLFIGLILGMFVSAFIILVSKIYRDIMYNET